MAPTDSCGCGEGVPSSRRGFGFPVVGRGSSGHGDGDVGGEVLIRWSLLPLPPAERREKEAATAGPKVGERR